MANMLANTAEICHCQEDTPKGLEIFNINSSSNSSNNNNSNNSNLREGAQSLLASTETTRDAPLSEEATMARHVPQPLLVAPK